MKKWISQLALIPALFGMMTTASAQDCCYTNPCCGNVFNGFYVGGNVGFASYHNETIDLNNYFANVTALVPSQVSHNNTSWEAGVQLGYDWVHCNRLVGIVGDWEWTDARTRVRAVTAFGIPAVVNEDDSIQSRVRWISTIRGRAGVVWNDSLFYLTAGGAYADFRTKIQAHFFPGLEGEFIDSGTIRHNRWGWTAGFGAEFACWCSWTVNAEILYMRFDTRHRNLTPSPAHFAQTDLSNYGFDFSDDIWVGRIGINYRFSLGNFF